MRLRVVVGGALALALAGLAVEAWRVLTPTPLLRFGPRVVEIPHHDGLQDIAERLGAEGVIRSPIAFIALSALRGQARRLKAGEYEFPQGAATPAVLWQIAAGAVRQHVVLHPEGATVAELARALESARLASAHDIEQA